MFGELAKLFDRNFAVGYFLPFAVFLAATLNIAAEYGLSLKIIHQLNDNLLIGTTTLGLLSWVGGICLLALNRSVIRFLEGYGDYNPLNLFKFIEVRRFKKVKAEAERLHEEYEASGSDFPPYKLKKLIRYSLERVERFPDTEHWLLPTPFGNTIRAFEVYPRVMYGVEGIMGWVRLLTVIPGDYRELVDTAKAQVDFWVNLGLLSAVFLAEYVALVMTLGDLRSTWLLILMIFIWVVSAFRAQRAASQWGELVKAAFDVYLPELYKKLELPTPTDEKDKRSIWTEYSQAVVYENPEAMPNRIQPIQKKGFFRKKSRTK